MEYPINIHRKPRLRNPSLVAGWTDAGLVGINAINYIVDKLGAKPFGEIEPPDYYSLPYSVIEGGVLKRLEYPGSFFYYWKNKKSRDDLIIMGSKPPDVNHYEFASLIVDVAEYFAVEKIYTLGGVYADISHTEEPRVFAVINSAELKEFLRAHDVEPGHDYHGPTSMNGLMLGIARHRNIDGISLWGTVPRYLADMPDLDVCCAVIRALCRLLSIEIDFTEIMAEAEHVNAEINDMIARAREQNPLLDEYMEKLGKHMKFEAAPEDSRRYIDEIEDFLKKQKKRGKDGTADK